MLIQNTSPAALNTLLNRLGLTDRLAPGARALIKLNLPAPRTPPHASDPAVVHALVDAINARTGTPVTLAEGADGHLAENLRFLGLGDLLDGGAATALDLDLQDAEPCPGSDFGHYIPAVLGSYDLRIGVPVARRLPGMVFSCAVKLLVGCLPRRYYAGTGDFPRPRLHEDLHASLADMHACFQRAAPFHAFFAGGACMLHDPASALVAADLGGVLAGNDALQLDLAVLRRFGLPAPEYLELVAGLATENRPADGAI